MCRVRLLFFLRFHLKQLFAFAAPPTSSFTFRHEFILVQVRLRDAQGRVASEHRLIAPLLLEEVLGALGEGRHAAASLRRRQVRVLVGRVSAVADEVFKLVGIDLVRVGDRVG